MTLRSWFRILCVFFAALPWQIAAAPGRPTDIAALTAGADVVVIGTVTERINHGVINTEIAGHDTTATDYTISVAVQHSIKGAESKPILSVDVVVPDMPTGVQIPTIGTHGVFFLRANGAMARFVDPLHGWLPARDTANLAGDPIDQVTSAVASVLAAPSVTETEFLVALDGIGRLRTKQAADGLKQAMTITSGERQVQIASALTARDDLMGLRVVADALVTPSRISNNVFADAAGSLAGISNPAAIPVLTRLLATGNPAIKKGAVVALRQTKSPAALKPLSSLLGDDELIVAYHAVTGMGEITGQDAWTPSFDTFQRSPRYYIEYWQRWTEQNLGH